jgi:hypothetical protein
MNHSYLIRLNGIPYYIANSLILKRNIAIIESYSLIGFILIHCFVLELSLNKDNVFVAIR